MDKTIIKVLKDLVSEGYKLKSHHHNGNEDWKKALQNAERILIENKTKE